MRARAIILARQAGLRTALALPLPPVLGPVYVGPRRCTRCPIRTEHITRARYRAAIEDMERGALLAIPCWCDGQLVQTQPTERRRNGLAIEAALLGLLIFIAAHELMTREVKGATS